VVERELQPRTVTLIAGADPPALPAPSLSRTLIAGASAQVSAPVAQQLGGDEYRFVRWSDGATARARTLAVAADTRLVAVFARVGAGGGAGGASPGGGDTATGGTTTPATAADDTPPTLDVITPPRARLASHHLRVRAACPAEPCHVSARATIHLRPRHRLHTRTVRRDLAAGERRTVAIHLAAKARRRLARALRHRPSPHVGLATVATDSAGNRTTARTTLALRR